MLFYFKTFMKNISKTLNYMHYI